MVSTLSRNGTAPKPALFTVPVDIPFYEGARAWYNAAAVRELLDGGIAALTEEFTPRETALDADADLPDADRAAQKDALMLDWAGRIIPQVVTRIEWPYGPAPDPADMTTFAGWDGRVLIWLAQIGLAKAGALTTGPLSLWMNAPLF